MVRRAANEFFASGEVPSDSFLLLCLCCLCKVPSRFR